MSDPITNFLYWAIFKQGWPPWVAFGLAYGFAVLTLAALAGFVYGVVRYWKSF